MSDKESKSPAEEGASAPPTGVGAPRRGAPGKRSRTQALPPSRAPATGTSTQRLQPRPAVARFDLTEIGRESYTDVTLTNVSEEEVDFFDFLQTILPAGDGVVRPEGDFAVVGGATTAEGLAPGASTAMTVAFHPRATGPDDLDKGRKTRRKARLAILDDQGAIAGTVPLEGSARPPSAETIDDAAVSAERTQARRAGRSPAVPRSFDDMRRRLLAARDLIGTSERDEAAELLDGVEARLGQAATYEHVYQAARKHGLGAITATKMVGDARAEISNVARKLHGDLAVLPVHLDTAVTMFEAAKEPLQLTLGEIKHAPTLQAMNDATPIVLAGKAAEELGETALELATDTAFAAGFGVGVLEGAGGALFDLVAGVGDAARLAFDLARAWLRGGMIGMSYEVATKLQTFFTKMPGALQAMGAAFVEGWNDPDSYARGNFRGEVISYVAAQIAIIVISGGAASQGVAFASLSRWGKVARVIETIDAAGDITSWARGAAKAADGADELLAQARRARGAADVGAPGLPHGSAPGAADGGRSAPRSSDKDAGSPKVDACFIAGTLVRTAGGDVPIERLVIGQRVIAADAETGAAGARAVMRTFVHPASVLLDLRIGDVTITCTPEHPFWVPGDGWRQAGALASGARLRRETGEEVVVEHIARREGRFEVHNVTVDDLSTYHVSSLGILVHNKPRRLDLETTFHLRRTGLFETVEELKPKLANMKARVKDPAHQEELAKLEKKLEQLERDTNGARYTPLRDDIDPAAPRFDPLERLEKLEDELLRETQKLDDKIRASVIPPDRPARDTETVLADGTGEYERTGKSYHSRSIYRDPGGRLFYVDNLHKGAASEIEVFNAQGEHLGTMTPGGRFQPEKRVKGRYLPKDKL